MTKVNNFPILPNDENVIGIIGGGQLGKMIALSASRAGYKTHLYCPKGDNPAEAVVDKITYGQWDDYCLLYTSPSPRDISGSRMPSSA